MMLSDLATDATRLLRDAAQLISAPRASLTLYLWLEPAHVRATYARLTQPHPRCRLIGHNTLGMALLDLQQFASPLDYLAAVSKGDAAARQARHARARGYRLEEIDHKAYRRDIRAIQAAADEAHGNAMRPGQGESDIAEPLPHFKYYGVLDAEGRLVAYCNYGIYGNFAATDQLMGYGNRHGVMYLLLMEIICKLIEDGQLRYFMFDSFLGASTGLRNFKRKLGFGPYHISYSME